MGKPIRSLPKTLLVTLLFVLTGIAAMAAVPRAHHLYISGTTAGANPPAAGIASMEVGFTLKVYYTYAGAPAEAGTTFQWFTYDDQFGTNKQPIAAAATGVAAQSFTLTAAQQGKHISVEVRPRNADGFGPIVEFRPWDTANPNPVLVAGNSCTKAGGGSVGPANNLDTTQPLCSPRATTWQVSYTGIDYSAVAPPRVSINWGDGVPTNTFTLFVPTLSNPLLTRADTFALAKQSAQTWTISQSHTYDYRSTPASAVVPVVTGQRCTFTLRASWASLVTGGTCTTSATQSQQFTVWDKEDNVNLGIHDINQRVAPAVPASGGVPVGEETLICEKDQTPVILQDASDFNCTPALETIRPNDEARWVQFVYGTATNIATGPGVTEKFIINGVSYTAAQLPVFGKVTYQPATTIDPLPAITDGIVIPTTAIAGQTLVITMRTWNTCNKLDLTGGNNPNQGLIPPTSTNFAVSGVTNQTSLLAEYPVALPIKAHRDPVTRIYTIRVITKPPLPVALNKEFCAGTTLNPGSAASCGAVTTAQQQISFELTAASVASSTAISWYFGNPALPGAAALTNAGNGTNCRFFRPGNLGNTGTQNTMKTAMAAGTPGVYSVWATYTVANGCTSDPVEVKMTIRPLLTAPVAPTGTSPVCNNSTVNGYTQGSAAVPVTINANTITNPAAANFATEYFWDTNNAQVTTSATTGTSVNVTYAISPEPNPSTTADLRTALRYSTPRTYATTPTPVEADYCQTTKTPMTVTVFGATVGGTTSPATQTICQGATPANITLSGQRGSVTGWEVQVNGAGGFNPDPTLGTGTTLVNPPVPIVGAVQTRYEFRAVVRNGPGTICAAQRSTVAEIIVNPKPISATLSGGATICQGNSTNLVVTIVGGTSPYTVTYTDGTTNFPVNSYVSGSNISVSPLAPGATYTLVSVTDAASCIPTTLSGNAVVTVSNPTSAVISPATQNVCPGFGTNFIVTITGGTGPYTVRYSANAGAPVTVSGYTSGDPIPTGVLAANTTYTIVDVRDVNNCLSLSNTGSAIVNVGAPLVSAAFSGGGNVCRNATANLVLTISGGVSPYHITVTPTSGPVIDNTNYSSGGNIPVPTTAVGSIDYTITLITDACGNSLAVGLVTGNPRTVNVTPIPVASTPKTVTAICSGGNASVDIFNTSMAGGVGGNGVNSTYAWTAGYPGGLTGGPANGTGDIGSTPFTLTNKSGGQLTAVFTVTPTAVTGGCPGTPFVINLPVNSEPVGAVTTTVGAACSNSGFTIDPFATSVQAPNGNNVTSTYTWTRSLAPGLTLITPGTLSGNIAETVENLTSTVKNVTYTVTPRSTGTLCFGTAFTIIVPINPEPVASTPKTTANQCSSVAFSFDPQVVSITTAGGNSVPSNFTWTATYDAGLTGGAASGTGNVAGTLVNRSGGVLNATYTVTPRAVAGNCLGQNFTIIVPVNAEADITAQPVNATTCTVGATSTGTATFTVTATGPGITYQWEEKVGAGSFTPLSNAGVYSGTGTSTLTITGATTAMSTNQYRVVMTTTGSCKATSTVRTLTVNPLPTANNVPIAQCSDAPGGTVAVLDLTTFNTNVNSGAGLTFTWWKDAAATTTPITPGTAGGQDQNYTTSNGEILYARVHNVATGCDNIGIVTFTINTTPVGNPIVGPTNVCVSIATVLYQVTPHAGSKYSWNIPSQITIFGGGSGAVSGGGQGPFGNDSYVLLIFPTAATGLSISVTERSAANCVGAPNTKTINVANGPTIVDILHPPDTYATPVASRKTSFCKDEKGVVFSVPANATSNFIWTIDDGTNLGGSIVGASAGTGLNQIIIDFNNQSSAKIDVTEINISGCPATYPSLVVSLVDSPILTPISRTICSGEQPSSVIDLNAQVTQPSTFTWFVKTIDTNITGAFQNDIGTGPLEHFPPLKNISGTNGTVVYTVTPTATGTPNCVGLSQDFTVIVKPEPVVNTIAVTPFCPGVPISIPLSSNVAGATLNWTSSNPAVGLVAASGAGTISFTAADNLTGANITSTINVTATSNGCTSAGGNSKTFVITIKPRPVITPITNIVVCPGEPINVPAFTANTGGGESYAWTNSNTSIALGSSGSGNIGGFFAPANNTGSNVVANISVTGTLNTCAGPPLAFSITVKPEPVISAVTDKFFCPGDVISIPLTTNVVGATINWSNSNTAVGLAASGVGDIGSASTFALANNTGADITATITISASDNGCTSTGTNMKSFVITVRPTPIVDAITDIEVCSGANIPTTVFGSNISTGAVTFNWTNDNTAIGPLAAAGAGNLPAFTAAANITGAPRIANISVTGTKNGCAGPARTFRIIVNPEPVVAAVTPGVFCPGDAVAFTLTSNVPTATISWTNTNPAIGIGVSGTGDISYTAPVNNSGSPIVGTITVTATDNSCTSGGTNAKSFTITIRPTPIVAAITDVVVCSEGIATIPFTANTGGGETFNWTSDNAAVLPLVGSGDISYTAPVNTSGVPMIANVTYSATRNGCPGPSKTFRIIVNPEPVVTTVVPQSFCPGETVSIALLSNVAGATISWTNTNSLIGLATSGTGDINFIAPANITGSDRVGTIKVSASKDGCTSSDPTNTKTFTITIKPTPVVNPITNVVVCSGQSVSAINFGSNAGAGVVFNWTNDTPGINLLASGTGNIAPFTAAVNTSSSPVVATISVTGTKNLCVGAPRTFTITILPQPVGTATATTICSDQAVGVNLNTLITGGAAASSYNVSITSNGLIASAGSPSNVFGVSATEILDDKWTNLTGATVDVVYHIVPISGSSPNCSGASFDFTVHVNPEPVVTAVTDKFYCPATAQTIPLFSNVTGATISWTNDNPSIGLGVSGSGNSIGFTTAANNSGSPIVANITVTASKDGCTSAGLNIKTFQITLKPTPIVNAVADVVVCSGVATPNILFAANTGGGEVFSWTNDNTTGTGRPATGTGNIMSFTPPVNTSGVPVVANFTVFATINSCAGPIRTFKVIINPEPVVATVSNREFCASESISIPLSSNVVGANITWTNDNTAIGIGNSGGGNIVYVAPVNNSGVDIVGTIKVSASKDGCTSSDPTNTKTFTITIKPTPVVDPVSNITVCSGSTIPLTTLTSNVIAPGVVFNWTNDNTAIGTLAASGMGNIPSFTAATNLTGSPIVATITVTGTRLTCVGPPRTFTITIDPVPVIDPTLDNSVCSGSATGLILNTNGTSVSALNYNIISRVVHGSLTTISAASVPVGGALGVSSIYVSGDKFKNFTNASLPVTYTVRAVGAIHNCVGPQITITVMIDPEPVVSTALDKTVCSNEDINLILNTNGTSVAAANYNIISRTVSGGLTIKSTAPIADGVAANHLETDRFENLTSVPRTVTYLVEPISGTLCRGAQESIIITINPEPTGSPYTEPGCTSGFPLSHDLQLQITNGVASVFTYTVTSNNPGVVAEADRTVPSNTFITHTYTNTTGSPAQIVYEVTAYTSAFTPNCQAKAIPTFVYVVNVDSKPVAAAVPRPPVCSGDAFSFNPQDEINAGNSVPSTFAWSLSYDGGAAVLGTGNITGTFVNLSPASKNAVFTVTPTSSSGSNCQGDPFIITIVIDPKPVMVAVPPVTICSTNTTATHQSNITLSTTGSSSPVSGYNIRIKTIDTGLDGIGTTPDAVGSLPLNLPASTMSTFAYNNVTAVPKVVVFGVSPVSSVGTNCVGAEIEVRITVNPEPVLFDPGRAPVCSSNTENAYPIGIVLGTNGTSVGAITYTLQQIDYSTALAGPYNVAVPTGVTRIAGIVGNSSTMLTNEKFTNVTGAPVFVRYTMIGTSAGPASCTSEPGFFFVQINPEPVFTPTTASTCSGIASGLILGPTGSSPAITGYDLKKIELEPGVEANTSGINASLGVHNTGSYHEFLKNDIFYNVTESNKTVTYEVAAISGNCVGKKYSIFLTILPAPALISNLDTKVCSNTITNIRLIDNSSGNAPLATLPFSAVADRFNVISVTPAAGLNVIAMAPTGITTNADIIKNDRFENPTNNPLTVVYRIQPIAANNCLGPVKTITVTIEPKIVAQPVNNKPNICSSEAISITLASPSIPTSPLITYSYRMLTVPGGGISGNTSATNVTAAAASPIEDVLVNNKNVPITVTYEITAIAGTAANGTGCISDIVPVQIVVEPKPKINTVRNKTICDGVPVGITITSPTYPSDPTRVQFEIISVTNPDGITGSSPVGTVIANGAELNDVLGNPTIEPRTITYELKPFTSGTPSCEGDPITFDVTINPRPVVTPSATTLEICSSESIEVLLPTDTDQSSTLVKWTAVASSADVVGESNGAGDVLFQTLLNKGTALQTVDYTITPSFNGCEGTPKHLIVTVNPIPNITVPSKITVCGGTPFNLDLSPLATTAVATTTFKWEVTDINGIGTPGQFDGTGTSINQSIVNGTDASASLLYQITPIFVGTGGVQCEGIPKIINVTVAPAINGAFISADEFICEGTPVFLTFDLQGQAPFEFVYRASDANGNVVDKTITKSGNVKVEKVTPLVTTEYEIVAIKDALGCAKTLSPMPKVTMTVFKKITAGWVANTPPFVGGNSAVGFTNTSDPVDGSTFRYEWTFDSDNSASPMTANGEGPFTVNYNRPGDHYVSLHAVNTLAEAVGQSCESTFASKITIPVLPLVAGFKVDPKAACFPENITVIENISTGDTMDWRVIDSNGRVAATSGASFPVFLISTPGLYTITLKTSNSLTGQEAFAPSVEVSIYENPVASFDLRPLLVYVPDTELTTFNFSTGAPEYLWDFGDGGTSTEKEPKYTYKVEGKYDVTLIAMNDHGDGAVCTDTLKRQVIAKQGGVTKVPNAFTPSPNGPNGGISGNNTFNDVFLPLVKGAEEFNMQVFDRWGNLIFESNNSNVGWDGYDKHGRLLPAGVYVYKLTLRLSDGQRSTQIGDITMIR